MAGDVAVIIPVAAYHRELAGRAAASVGAQTVGAEIVRVDDPDGRGAGWARNRGLERVTAPYVVFLDADDRLEPDFVERTLAQARAHPDRYLYTDWFEDGRAVAAPERAWVGRAWHIVTALVPTAWARSAGGFDESLPGAEDTDFYLKLAAAGRRGLRLALPLVHYGAEGRRSRRFRQSAAHDATMRLLLERYGRVTMGCGCGETTKAASGAGARLAGDVPARARWAGNRAIVGRVSGRHYPRLSRPDWTWVDPRDAAASPDLWEMLSAEAAAAAPDFAGAAALMQAGIEGR